MRASIAVRLATAVKAGSDFDAATVAGAGCRVSEFLVDGVGDCSRSGKIGSRKSSDTGDRRLKWNIQLHYRVPASDGTLPVVGSFICLVTTDRERPPAAIGPWAAA